MAKSIASGQNVDEQNLLKIKSEKRDVIKRNIDTIIDHSKNGIEDDTLVKIMELMSHNLEKIDIENIKKEIKKELKIEIKKELKIEIKKELKIEIKKELKIEIKKEILNELNFTEKELVKKKELNKEDFLSFFIKDLKRIKDINEMERHIKALMNQDALESSVSGIFPNLKMYFDEFINHETWLEKNAYKVNQALIRYDFSYKNKQEISDWIDEVKKTSI